MKSGRLSTGITLAALIFIHAPLCVMIAHSFNASKFGTSWKGFTLQWYERLFQREDLWLALVQSLEIAALASLAAMILGTCAALALHRHRSRLQRFHQSIVTLPLVLPEILMGMSLLLLFVACGFPLGKTSILLAHTTFCISYVSLTVSSRLQDFDDHLLDAARDLGATPWQSFRRVTLPLLLPGILAGGLLAFTVSIDDFVVTFFVKGPGTDTLPVVIYSMIKKSREIPVINALSTLLIAATFLLAWSAQRLQRPRPA